MSAGSVSDKVILRESLKILGTERVQVLGCVAQLYLLSISGME